VSLPVSGGATVPVASMIELLPVDNLVWGSDFLIPLARSQTRARGSRRLFLTFPSTSFARFWSGRLLLFSIWIRQRR
jgi:hypothetical protein